VNVIGLPNTEHETMPDWFLVFHIAGQILCEKVLFVNEPPYQEWHHKYNGEEPQYEPRASGEPIRYSNAQKRK
jgi:hypothetical protein